MPKPRYSQVSVSDTPYYHCVSRCVRRAFLCGTDSHTGQCYEHRRQWIEDQIIELAGIFALDVCAYAVMSNHYHIVLHVNALSADQWTFDEVIQRWHRLFNGNLFSRRYMAGLTLLPIEHKALSEAVEEWRRRLTDISWFMRTLNEPIAREANKEDLCTGRFWEGRFKSQALLDEKALLACMAYVDLNPIRACMAKTPETSNHTSIQTRIAAVNQHLTRLFPFVGNPRQPMPQGLPFKLSDYIGLVDWTGRIIRQDKRGHIDETLPPILERLSFQRDNWLYVTTHFESKFKTLVGAAQRLKQVCQSLGYQRCTGIQACLDRFT